MGLFDYFRFDRDFKFQNHKGDVVIIEKDVEFQTKDVDNMMYKLIINDDNEIEHPIYKHEVNKSLPDMHPLKWKTMIDHYEKIDKSGKIQIYHFTNEIDYIYNIWVENGKIYKVEDLSHKNKKSINI